MCNHCNEDPRDELAYGVKALQFISELVREIHQGKDNFDLVKPAGLSELLDMVEGRIGRAAMALQSYVPRDWTPPQG